MSRKRKAIGLMGALILALAFLPALDQPNTQQSGHVSHSTAQVVMYAGIMLEYGGYLEFGTTGAIIGATTAGISEVASVFGFWGAWTAPLMSAAVVTMAVAA